MSMVTRILLSLAILAVDLVVFFLPLTALFLIYILLANPPWFREFLEGLDRGEVMGDNTAPSEKPRVDERRE